VLSHRRVTRRTSFSASATDRLLSTNDDAGRGSVSLLAICVSTWRSASEQRRLKGDAQLTIT
jgi:hypothetical protein